jgi:hypothetical protein
VLRLPLTIAAISSIASIAIDVAAAVGTTTAAAAFVARAITGLIA